MTEPTNDYRPSPDPTPVIVVDDPNDPHEVWFKDEKLRLFGRQMFSNRGIVVSIISSLVAVVIVFGWVLYRTYTAGSDTQDYLHKARADRLSSQRKERQDRIASQNAVTAKLAQLDQAIKNNISGTRDLACSVVLYLDSQPQDRQTVKFSQFLSTRYSCTGYRPGPALPLPSTAPKATPAPSTAPGGSGGGATGSSGSGGSSGGGAATPRTPAPTKTVVRRTPGQATTRTVTKTPPAPRPAPTTSHIACVLILCIG